MTDPADRADAADLARLRSRAAWTGDEGADPARSLARAECDATRSGHLAVVMEPGEVPRCEHCGASLSPDALRRAGVKGRKA